MQIKPVILCGGAGTRLWPKSKKNLPKQFIDFGGWTLFQKTLQRIQNPVYEYPIISTNLSYLNLVRKYLTKYKIKKYKIVLEPYKKNTASAILSSALLDDIPFDKPILFFPADHLIEQNNAFNKSVYLNSKKLSIAAFEKFDSHNIFFKEYDCETNLNKSKLNFENVKKTIEKNIFEIEKKTGEFLEDIYLMVETPESISINLSLIKNNEGKKIEKKNVQYLIQDAKQQILRNYHTEKIIHIIITNYLIDNTSYNYLPLNLNCNRFSIDIKFICFPKNLIKELEKLFNSRQIFINKIICSHYAKSFTKNKSYINVCETGLKLIKGINKQEVAIVPRKLEKKGFFERLFHFFK